MPTGQIPSVSSSSASPSVSLKPDRNMLTATITGIVLGVVFLLSVFINEYIFLVFVLAMIVVSIVELWQATRQSDRALPLIPMLCASIAIAVSTFFGGIVAMFYSLVIVIAFLTVVCCFDADRDQRRAHWLYSVFVTMWIPFCLSFFYLIYPTENGQLKVLLLILITTACDIGGHQIGRLWGRHKIFPKVSPNKTLEGLIGSFGFSVVMTYVAIAFISPRVYSLGFILIPLLISVAGTISSVLGDLLESMVKRDLDIKDSGKFLPGHGGVLDRIDSIVLTAPVLFYVFSWLVL